MSRRRRPVCAVCGASGYWTGYSPFYGEDRCINHLHTEERAMALDESARPNPDSSPNPY
jgi:hypothetical protein